MLKKVAMKGRRKNKYDTFGTITKNSKITTLFFFSTDPKKVDQLLSSTISYPHFLQYTFFLLIPTPTEGPRS